MFHGYQLFGVIGSGTYGEVYKAAKGRELTHEPWFDASGPPYYAVKRQIVKEDSSKPAKKEGEDTSFSVSLLREIKILRELKHPNIVNMCDLIVDPKTYELALVFDYAEYEMMKIIDYYKTELKDSIPEYTVKSFMSQSLKGLKYLHENWIIHRDLKPENILIVGGEGPNRGNVLLADLGLARIFRNPVSPLGIVDKVVVTLWYRAPELLLGATDYSPAIDMWSMGCIFAALLMAKAPNVKALFQGKQIEKEDQPAGGPDSKKPPFQHDQCDKIFRILGVPKPATWPGVELLPDYQRIKHDRNYPQQSVLSNYLKPHIKPHEFDSVHNLLSRMLTLNPAERISAADALGHPYFSSAPLPGENAIDVPGQQMTSSSRGGGLLSKHNHLPSEVPKPLPLHQRDSQTADIINKRKEVKERLRREEYKRQKMGMYEGL